LATRAAGKTVDPALHLHSLHSYFLSFGDVDHAVLYTIERLRDGRSYATRTVRAIQKGKAIFVLVASYQRPEPEQPTFQIDVGTADNVFAGIPAPDVSLPLGPARSAV
jgi:acyl-CoA thioesterase 8